MECTSSPTPSVSSPSLSDLAVQLRESTLDRLLGINSTLNLNQTEDQHPGVGSTPTGFGKAFLAAARRMKAAGITPSGDRVDYALLSSNPAYVEFKARLAPGLSRFNPAVFTNRQQKLAFWINLYNALVIDAVIHFQVRQSVTEDLGILRFFRNAAYRICHYRISAEDIEHGILRANRGNPYLPGPHFANRDPRAEWALPEIDPRIHFALNCASNSCPPIGFYDPEQIDKQLDQATTGFLEHEVEIHPAQNVIRLSKIFQWYAGDFNGREGTLDFLLNYLPATGERTWLEENRHRVRLKFHRYDWRLNGRHA